MSTAGIPKTTLKLDATRTYWSNKSIYQFYAISQNFSQVEICALIKRQ